MVLFVYMKGIVRTREAGDAGNRIDDQGMTVISVGRVSPAGQFNQKQSPHVKNSTLAPEKAKGSTATDISSVLG
jgi:hypothetical protein